MNKSSDKKQTNKKSNIPFMTKHFAERYFERIWSKPSPKNFHKGIYKNIRNDMNSRMLGREKMSLELFANSSEALVPIARFNKMVVRKNVLVTIY